MRVRRALVAIVVLAVLFGTNLPSTHAGDWRALVKRLLDAADGSGDAAARMTGGDGGGFLRKLVKLSSDLQRMIAEGDTDEDGLYRVVFRYEAGTSAEALVAGTGAILVRDYPRFHLAVVRGDEAALALLFGKEGVSYGIPDRELIATGSFGMDDAMAMAAGTMPDFADLDGHVRVTTGAAAAFDEFGTTGEGVVVAVVDSGIAEHPDLAGRIVGRVDFVGDGDDRDDPYGHGTWVAGLVAGNGLASMGSDGGPRAGTAPAASLYDLRVLDAEGKGRLSSLLEALDWLEDNAEENGIRVVNLSVGTLTWESFRDDPLCDAVEELVEDGLVVVAAAGNLGRTEEGDIVYGAIVSPATDPMVITVGAANTLQTDYRSDDIMTTYSSRGPTRTWTGEDLDEDGTISEDEKHYDMLVKPDLLAPGNRIVGPLAAGSTIAEEHPELAVGGSYVELSGTSAAAPIVSGIVADLLEQRPDLTPGLVKLILMGTAQPLGGDVPPIEQVPALTLWLHV